MIDYKDIPRENCPHCGRNISIAIDEQIEHVLQYHQDLLQKNFLEEEVEIFKRGITWTPPSPTL